ncbi:MAG: glutaminase A [Gloeocapsa sp. DLM2.Bin57]|nr:MAG: glutaminase A [Gloeocapsa sp. DLM2.Bin57]
MISLNNLQQQQLDNWIDYARAQAQQGVILEYIPLLNAVDSNAFAVCILTKEEKIFSQGDTTAIVPLMSVIKPFLLLYLLDYYGAEIIFQRVGKQPSIYPFNSLLQLRQDQGFPRNPMLNSGAMSLAALLPGKDGYTRCENLRIWLNDQANCNLELEQSVLDSVKSLPNQKNQALIQELFNQGYIIEPFTTLDTYNHICCLAGNILDFAKLGMLLIDNNPNEAIVREVMLSCGLYEASQDFQNQIGLPTKSGVSGIVLSIIPQQGAIACYSPPLNFQGNSVVGLALIKLIAQYLQG